MNENDARGMKEAYLANDLLGVDKGSLIASLAEFVVVNGLVADIEKDDVKELLGGIAKHHPVVVSYIVDGISRGDDPFRCFYFLSDKPSGEFEGCLDFDGFCFPYA